MQQQKSFNEYINAFEKKLEFIDIAAISAEPYCRKYLGYLLQHRKFFLAVYADILNKLASHLKDSKEETQLVDFGAGNGLLGIFAKFCGFKKVFLNDIDGKFVNASEKLAQALGIGMDGYITGDISSVRSHFKEDRPTAIIGTDVIEHIYDLQVFFKTIQQINPSMVSVFSTASNPCNYFKVRSLQKLQVKDELEGGTPDDHTLFGEQAHEPYLKIREQIIRTNAGELPGNKIAALAKATRGRNEQDILAALKDYKESGKIPIPAAGSNTCNPLNGSWTERILSLDVYISLYEGAGFTCKFYAGFYNDYEDRVRNFVKKLLNTGITIFGKKISPYIVIVGTKK